MIKVQQFINVIERAIVWFFTLLIIRKSTEPGVIILEYEVHGVTPANRPYDNSFCSIITIKDRKIVYRRDYMDSLAVMFATI